MTSPDADRRLPWLPAAAAAFAVAWGGNQFTPLLGLYETLGGHSQATVNMLLFAYAGGIVPALFLAPTIRRLVPPAVTNLCGVVLSLIGGVLLGLGADSVTLLVIGRVLSGAALGHGMVAAAAWLQDILLTRGAASRRLLTHSARIMALSLTAGFGLGAGIAGAVAQFLPRPLTAAYVPHAVVCLIAIAVIARTLGRHPAPPTADRTRTRERTPRRLILAVMPAAPLIFGSLGIAYAVLSQRLSALGTTTPVGYLALLCLIALGAGFATQQVIRILPRGDRLPAPALGLLVVAVVLMVAALGASHLTRASVLLAAAGLGVGYGLIIIGCLTRIQVFGPLSRQAVLTAWMYCFAYLGFGLPMTMSLLSGWLPYPVQLPALAVLAGCAAVITEIAARRLHHLDTHA